MPTPALLRGTGLTSATQFPYFIFINGNEVAVSSAQLESISIEEMSEDDEIGSARFMLWDPTNALLVEERDEVRIYDHDEGREAFLGFVDWRRVHAAAVGRWIEVQASAAATLLDHILIPGGYTGRYELGSPQLRRLRRYAESDRTRVLFLWGSVARAPLSGDVSQVQQTNASLADDDYANLTLRQAFDQIAGLAGTTTHYYIDTSGRLHWYAETEAAPAPFNINVAVSPGGGNIAPTDLEVTRDGRIVNRYFVQGANKAGSIWVQDDASVARYGLWEGYLPAPTADTAAKATALARRELAKTAYPATRGTFSTTSPNDGWRANQNVQITSPQDGLAAAPFRIVRVKTSFLRGDGLRRYDVDFGKVRAKLTRQRVQPGRREAGGIPAQVVAGQHR